MCLYTTMVQRSPERVPKLGLRQRCTCKGVNVVAMFGKHAQQCTAPRRADGLLELSDVFAAVGICSLLCNSAGWNNAMQRSMLTVDGARQAFTWVHTDQSYWYYCSIMMHVRSGSERTYLWNVTYQFRWRRGGGLPGNWESTCIIICVV